MSLDSDSSSSDDEDTNKLLGVCDPTFSGCFTSSYGQKGAINIASAAVEQITGDKDLDTAISGLKERMNNIYGGDLSSMRASDAATVLRSSMSLSTASSYGKSRTGGRAPVPYVCRVFSQVMTKKVRIREHDFNLLTNAESSEDSKFCNHSKSSLDSNDSSTSINSSKISKSGKLLLLPGVKYKPRKAGMEDHDAGSPEWMRNIKRQQGYFYNSDEEEGVERKCREVALSVEFIQNGGLNSAYAEHRNKNPKKVEHVRLLKKGSINGILRIAPLLPKKNKANTSNPNTASSEKVLKKISQRSEKTDSVVICNEVENGEPPAKKKKVKSRKRGPKKRKGLNGDATLDNCESVDAPVS